ncbi:50S ribosomal protein L17 [Geobacter argillaceus]|uniref:Large ribosomal subunit protein bL17 n=1 Tax=Geobacter argillaceus TaxID=345631 RepID=A0A562VKA0_9BACT|nr:50S ribosomal protein L17 [Geobacter argillaceus]TWJ18310.1 LSU ribosomal protein L17P [Geobacter argillaceus]
MRHNKAGRRLGRTTSHRVAMFRNMVTSLFNHEKITTTDSKAKELRSIAEKMITLGKRGDLHAMRQAASYIRDKSTVTKLFTTIAPRYKERQGGYTRIIKLSIRQGDNAPVSLIELVEEELTVKATKKAPAKKAAAKPVAAKPVEQAPVQEAAPAEEAAVPQTAVVEPDENCEAKAD